MKVIGIIAAGVALFIAGAVAASATDTTATPPATTTSQTPPPATGEQTPATPPATGEQTQAATQPDPNEKICKKDETTGTRISKVCKTRKEWEEDAKNTNDF
jgi:hypothetical protein